MRIFWQSFVDASVNAPYMARLSEYLNNIAAPGTTVQVEGISPPDREFGRLAELRCAVQAIDNGIAATSRIPGFTSSARRSTSPWSGPARRRCLRPRNSAGASAS
jgi:hypothetical protein